MKKFIILLIAFMPISLMAQNFVKGPVDSVTTLIKQVEQFTGTQLTLRKRNDSLENYLFRDSTGFVKVKLNMKNVKELEGLKVRITPLVDYIVISGPTPMMEKLFNTYLKNCTDKTDEGVQWIKTKKWEAAIQDEKIINKDGIDIDGKAIWIAARSNL
jgi:hypothetical protein